MADMILRAKSATRVDFSGGTLDLWPLSTLIKDATTVNCSISCYTSVSFVPGETFKVSVESPDFKDSFTFKTIKDFLRAEECKLSLLQQAFAVLEDEAKGFGEWCVKSESPAGSGLGGSSSILISMLKVIFNLNEEDYTEKSIIESAKNIESRVLGTPAGIQDYFSPIKEGLNLITYKESGFEREDIGGSLLYWKDSITIVDSQIKHHSGMNNWEILKKYIDKDPKVVRALQQISDVSQKTAEALQTKSIEDLAKSFLLELEARKEVSSSYINFELADFLEKLNKIEGVLSLKVCGAGGGGCVMVLHKPEDKEAVVSALKAQKVSVLPFHLTGDL